MKSVNILGIEVSDVSYAQALSLALEMLNDRAQHYITTPNPEIVLKAKRSFMLRRVINASSLRLADGIGLKVGALMLGERLSDRIPGTDFAESLMASLSAEQEGVFFLGGHSEETAQKAVLRLKERFPNLSIAGAAHGGVITISKGSCSAADSSLIGRISDSRAAIVFVGFGCPKQELWINSNAKDLPNVKLFMTVGGAIDFWAGEARRAPEIVREAGFEWLWRLIQEPARFKRIFNATFRFLWETAVWRVRMSASYRRNVAACIINSRHEILIVRRAMEEQEHWQLPQGGVDRYENEEDAVLREISEETGITSAAIVGKSATTHRYDWPVWHRLNGGYRGQQQSLFFLAYNGDGSDISVDEHEICEYRWVPPEKLVESVHEKRRPLARMAIAEWKLVAKNRK